MIQDVGWRRRPACMTKPLSNDIRKRLVSAVDGGMTRRCAARRFGVAASTAIKWVDRWRRTGEVGPRPRGGGHRSQRIEAHGEEILALIEETQDITLAELADHLRACPWSGGRAEHDLAPTRPSRDGRAGRHPGRARDIMPRRLRPRCRARRGQRDRRRGRRAGQPP